MNILLAAASEAEIMPFTQHLEKEWERLSPSVFSKAGNTITVCITGVGMKAATQPMRSRPNSRKKPPIRIASVEVRALNSTVPCAANRQRFG